MLCLMSVTSFQKRVTMGLFTEAGVPLASKLLMTLAKEGLLGIPCFHVGLLSSQSRFNPVCPWAVLGLYYFLLLLSVIAIKVFQLDSAWALAFSKLLEATIEVSSPSSEAFTRLLNPGSAVVPPSQQ